VHALLNVQPMPLVLGIVGLTVCRLLRAARWFVLARASGLAIPLLQLFRVWMVTDFLGMFVPLSGGVDVLNVVGLSRYTGNNVTAASVVLIDRMLGALVLALAASVATMAAGASAAVPVPSSWIAAVVLCALGTCAAVTFPFHPTGHRVATALTARLHWQRLGMRLQRVYDASYEFRNRGRALWQVAGIVLINQGIGAASIYGLSEALNLGVPFVFYLIAIPVLNIVEMLPLSVGGVGVAEGALTSMLVGVGVAVERSVALALLYRVVWIAMALPGGILYATGGLLAHRDAKHRSLASDVLGDRLGQSGRVKR